MKGDDMERELMAVLRGHGFVPMRSPGSGTGDWDQPDVLAGDDGVVIATELKSGKRPKNVEDDEVDALQRFAGGFGAAALVAVRYKHDRTFYLVRPEKMGRTPSNHYSIPKDETDLPWDVALPYTDGHDNGVQPIYNTGSDGVVYAPDCAKPSFRKYLTTLAELQRPGSVEKWMAATVDAGGDGGA